MRITRAIGVIGFSCVVGLGCAASGSYAPETYMVRAQDTLYSIAWRHDLDYRDLARWNNIGPDYHIKVGQVLVLKPSTRASQRPPSNASMRPRTGERPEVSSGAPGRPLGTPATQWCWPTLHASPPRPVPGGGILLLGQLGQPVRAASGGRVVYAGNGIRGYGNLIIIKHGDTLLSAYAHTREVSVHEGEDVLGGQVIAQMGLGPHQIAALYFEIRRNGKPVDPLPFLPVPDAR